MFIRVNLNFNNPTTESVDLKGIVVVPPPSKYDITTGWLQTAAIVMIGTGVLVASTAYAYDVYKKHKNNE